MTDIYSLTQAEEAQLKKLQMRLDAYKLQISHAQDPDNDFWIDEIQMEQAENMMEDLAADITRIKQNATIKEVKE